MRHNRHRIVRRLALIVFIAVSILSPLIAIFFSDNISAFIGISLVFIGALLFYISPTRFIRKTILDSTITQNLKQNHQLIRELGYQGKPTYVSPSTILGFKEAKLYVKKSTQSPPPTNQQLTFDNVFIDNPASIKLTPPGDGLHKLIENELRTDFSTTNPAKPQSNLEQAIVEGLEIAESFELEFTESTASATTKNNIFEKIIEELEE